MHALAAGVGAAESTLFGYENGSRRPRRDIAKRIEAFTKGAVTAAELLGVDARPPHRNGVAETSAAYQADDANTATIPIPAPLFELATSFSLDIPALVAEGGIPRLREATKAEYYERNKEGIESTRRYIEAHGTPGEQMWRQLSQAEDD